MTEKAVNYTPEMTNQAIALYQEGIAIEQVLEDFAIPRGSQGRSGSLHP